MIDLSMNYSRRVLLRLFVLLLIAVALVLVGLKAIGEVYFSNQLTDTGLIINGIIVGLFVIGTLKIFVVLMQYQGEESALKQVADALEEGDYLPESEVSPKRLISQRLAAVRSLSKRSAPVDHSALAATLLASESTRISFARFVNNTLILIGVFGTIVSLSMALVGASDLLSNVESMGGMERVIHGMSTALSTTMTAIVCYLFFGYFFIKLTDTQTRLLSAIEQVTTLHLLPQYAHSSDTMLHEVAGLVRSLQQVVTQMQQAQGDYLAAGQGLREVVDAVNQQVTPMGQNIETIKGVLHEGFRLPPKGDSE
jgi:type VI protein secretion system component VasK